LELSGQKNLKLSQSMKNKKAKYPSPSWWFEAKSLHSI
jgi:hypothetical protein